MPTSTTPSTPMGTGHSEPVAGSPYIWSLETVDRADLEHVGAKSANLGALLQAGFPVPTGFIVTTTAFERFVSASDLGVDSTIERVASSPLPADVRDAILAAAAQFAAVPVAVRSSGVSEDLGGASFAGQYETVLDVRAPAAVLEAVRHCWASSFSSRVASYDARQAGVSGTQPRRMAVLVQIQIEADAAGVAFTANPVTGRRDEVVVSAVRGLGERLVSGLVSPDEWLVRDTHAVRRAGPENAIDANQTLRIARLARSVEDHFGAPQDIEWALAQDELFLLQARPITTRLAATAKSPSVAEVAPPPGYWAREASHYPRPFSPLFRSVFLPRVNAGLRNAFSEAGLLVEGVEHREISGWVYVRLVPLGGKDRAPLPAWIMQLVRWIVPPLRTRIAQCVDAVRSDRFFGYVERWSTEWRPALNDSVARLRQVDLATLGDRDLRRHVEDVLQLVDDAQRMHQLLAAGVSVTLADLAFTCQDLLGWDDQRTFGLLAGFSDKSTETSRKLAELAELARRFPGVLEELRHIDDLTPRRLARAYPEFASAFDTYQNAFGARALRYEVADPTPLEVPTVTLRLLRDQLASRFDAASSQRKLLDARDAAVAAARSTLAEHDFGGAARERFDRALARAEQAYPVREDNGFYTVGMPLALVRYAALEVGRRLVERGSIVRTQDVFFLEVSEALDALGSAGTDRRLLVDLRTAERARVEAAPVRPAYGHRPPPPGDLSWLPTEARFAMQALMWVFDRITAQQESERDQNVVDGVLRGIAASPGVFTGPARVITSEDEFDRLQPGDVLVCPITSPVWSVLFATIGALVTDAGGILSHPAIIAREFSVPAVVATGSGTRRIRDGEIVTVDGDAGCVHFGASR